MKVLIINGAYGYVPKLPNGEPGQYVLSITRADGPIDLDEKEAKRLVDEGIARYVEDEPTDSPVPFEAVDEADDTPLEEAVQEDEEEPDFEAMSFAELKAYAQNNGIENVGKYRSKAALIEAITGKDDLPDLVPQDVVEE